MKIPQIFVPERNLETVVKTYLKDRQPLHKDPNIASVLGEIRLHESMRDRSVGENFAEAYKRLEKTSKECLCAGDFFETLEQMASETNTPHEPTLETLREAKKTYDQKVKEDIYQAFLGDPLIIKRGVMNYVTMIIGLGAEFRKGNSWSYMDPQTKQHKTIIIDEKYINSVEEEIGLKNQSQKESFRRSIMKVYAMKISTDPRYDFMDNHELVRAVTNTQLKLYIAEAGSLIGTLANRTNEDNKQLYDRMIKIMLGEQGYCKTCAGKTIEYFCTYRGQ